MKKILHERCVNKPFFWTRPHWLWDRNRKSVKTHHKIHQEIFTVFSYCLAEFILVKNIWNVVVMVSEVMEYQNYSNNSLLRVKKHKIPKDVLQDVKVEQDLTARNKMRKVLHSNSKGSNT